MSSDADLTYLNAVRETIRLPRRVAIGFGCDMGHQALANAFLADGCQAYIGPVGAPFRYASALVPILLFYELTALRPPPEALERIRSWDSEMEMWRLYEQSVR